LASDIRRRRPVKRLRAVDGDRADTCVCTIHSGKEAQVNVSATSVHLTTAMVGSRLAGAAAGDGDGLTGAAALNDGDAAAQAAARSVKHAAAPSPAATPTPPARPGGVDVRA
jgi:hypothetical protein